MECTSEKKMLCGEGYVEAVVSREFPDAESFSEGYLQDMAGLFGLQALLKLQLLDAIWGLCRGSPEFSVKFGKVERMEFSERFGCRVQTVNNMLGSLVSSGLVLRKSRGTYTMADGFFPDEPELDSGGLILRICVEYRISKRRI